MRTLLLLALSSLALSAQVAGQWRADIETQVGTMKYLYTFQTEGAKLTGTAQVESSEGKRESKISQGKQTGDRIQFTEIFNYQGNDLRIEYSGVVAGDEIQFTRQVAEYATEHFVARRVPKGKP